MSTILTSHARPISIEPAERCLPERHRAIARGTGFAYLGIVATGIFAEFVVRGSLIEADDAIATAANIAASPGLFGVGIGADVAMILLDVVVAVGLFRLLRRVDGRLALGAMVLRLAQGAVIAVNLVNLGVALGSARDAVGEDPDGVGWVLAGPARDALDAVERHALGYDAGLIAFGLSCLVLARLLFTSGVVSGVLAVGMGLTGVVYLVGSLTAFVAPGVNAAIDPMYVIAAVVEPAFAISLIRGLRPPRPRSGTTAAIAAPAA